MLFYACTKISTTQLRSYFCRPLVSASIITIVTMGEKLRAVGAHALYRVHSKLYALGEQLSPKEQTAYLGLSHKAIRTVSGVL